MAYNIENYLNELQYESTVTSGKNWAFNGSITAASIAATALTGANGGLVPIGSTGSVTAAGGSAVINSQRGIVTTASLSTATLAVSTFDIVNNLITSTSTVFASVYNGSNTGGAPTIGPIKVGAGSCTVTIINAGGAALGSLNGTLLVPFIVTA